MEQKNNLSLRKAEREDAQEGAALMLRAMGRFEEIMFPERFRNRLSAHGVLARLFRKNYNRFSFRYADAAVDGGCVSGLLVSYPGRTMPLLALPTGVQLISACGTTWALEMIRNVPLFLRMKESLPDEYYINTVAVFPEYAGKGIGTQLMKLAEEKAKKSGLKKCSLTVDVLNEHAVRLYERLGYKIVETEEISQFRLYRMVKDL